MPSIAFDFGMTPEALNEADTVFASDLLRGRRALVSGGGSGIGFAIAWLFARLGASVVLCGRKEDRLQAAVAQMAQFNLAAEYVVLDIRQPEEVEQVMDDLFAAGNLDLLVNNAGGQFPQPAIDYSPRGWQSVIDTNLNGTWYMMQAAARRWRDGDHPGAIVNMVVVTDDSMHGVAHTCAARAGVITLSQKLSVEWAPYNIRINCVAPGVTDSEGMRVYSDEARAQFHNANPLRRACSIWDIAQACVYLSSEAASFVTGEVLHLDGGSRHWGELWTHPRPSWFENGGSE